MPIPVICGKCGHFIEAPDGADGMQARCPKCLGCIVVPGQVPNTPSGKTVLVTAGGSAEAAPATPQALGPVTFRFYCPTCRGAVDAARNAVGQKMPCPHCGQRLQVPQLPPNKTVLGSLTRPVDALPAIKPAPAALSPPTPPADDYAPQRHGYRRWRGGACPCCGSAKRPEVREEISQEGWIVFAILLVVFFPVCWIPLITMKKRHEICRDCRARFD